MKEEVVAASETARSWIWVGCVVLAIAWFGTLGLRPLYRADESRYGEIPREMLESGDWVTPRLNGFRYFEKPPLQYWVTASFYRVFGVGEFAARLWTALAGFLGLLLTLAAGRRLFGSRVGWTAAGLLVASPLYVGASQFTTLDMGLTFFMAASVFAFVVGQTAARPAWTLAFWAACALAVLSKGLVGIVLPLAAVGLYVLVRRDWTLLGRIELVRGGALFLAIAAPWFVAVSLANSEFAHFFFVQEHLERFLTRMHHRYQPFWYFVPVLALGAAPWVLALGAGWVRALRRKPVAGFDARLFLAIWALTVFVFFSVSNSKLPSYILPIFPALAVLAGDWLSSAGAASRRLLQLQFALSGVLAALLARLAYADAALFAGDIANLVGAYVPWLVAGAGLLGAGAIGALLAVRKGRCALALGLTALGSFACTQLALVGHRTLSSNYSVESLVAALPSALEPDARVFAVEGYDHSMPWTLRRRVTMVRSKDELAKAIRWDPEGFIADLRGFVPAWREAPVAYAFVPVRDFDRIRAQTGLEMRIIARGPRYVFVRKP